MSEDNEAALSCCASCGIAEIDDVELVPCDGCDLVRYCSDDCREVHRKQHKRECMERAAELRDKLLFKQPEGSHHGDCPICMIPLPLDQQKSTLMGCCSKVICNGCSHAGQKREFEMGLKQTCPFCRKPAPETVEEHCKQLKKRIEANDPNAMYQEKVGQRKTGNYSKAFVNYTKAAELGHADSHYSLSIMYRLGQGVEKDRRKEVYHLEEAAIVGQPSARHNLGNHEWNSGNIDRAVKHWVIAATQGEDNAIKALIEEFKMGFVEKEVLAATLRAHQSAIDATKSPQREAAEKNY